jgi:hypothetical protein
MNACVACYPGFSGYLERRTTEANGHFAHPGGELYQEHVAERSRLRVMFANPTRYGESGSPSFPDRLAAPTRKRLKSQLIRR